MGFVKRVRSRNVARKPSIKSNSFMSRLPYYAYPVALLLRHGEGYSHYREQL